MHLSQSGQGVNWPNGHNPSQQAIDKYLSFVFDIDAPKENAVWYTKIKQKPIYENDMPQVQTERINRFA